VLLVVVGEEGLLDDFELVPAFEAAVVSTLGLFLCGLCFVCPLRFFGLVSKGGLGLFRRETFEEELELSGIDLFAFDSVEDLNESIDLLLKKTVSFREFGDDTIFVVGRFDGLLRSRSGANCVEKFGNSSLFRTMDALLRHEGRRHRRGD